MTFVGIIGNPRNESKYLLAGPGRFEFLPFYPETNYISSDFPHLPLRFDIPRKKYISLRVDFLPAHLEHDLDGGLLP